MDLLKVSQQSQDSNPGSGQSRACQIPRKDGFPLPTWVKRRQVPSGHRLEAKVPGNPALLMELGLSTLGKKSPGS